jgi:hypothetical protein
MKEHGNLHKEMKWGKTKADKKKKIKFREIDKTHSFCSFILSLFKSVSVL